MNFASFLDEQRRSVVLDALNEAAVDVAAALPLLHRYCVAVGLNPTAEQVADDLRLMAALGLLTSSERNGLVFATITQRGRDVAAGRVRVAGVADRAVR